MHLATNFVSNSGNINKPIFRFLGAVFGKFFKEIDQTIQKGGNRSSEIFLQLLQVVKRLLNNEYTN